jgi:GWxTD domain-containing protein
MKIMKYVIIFVLVIILSSLIQAQENTTYAYMQAGKAFKEGAYQKSLKIAKSISTNDPSYENARLLTGHCFLKLDSLDEAENAFTEIIDINNQSARAYNGLGLVYFSRKSEDKVVIRFIKSLFFKSNESCAENLFLQAIELDNKYPEAKYNLANLYFHSDDEDKLKSAENILYFLATQYPENTDYKLLQGLIKQRIGKLKEFQNILISLVKTNPDVAIFQLELAFVEFELHNYDRFSEHYLAGIKNLKNKEYIEKIFRDTYDILDDAEIEKIQELEINGQYYYDFWQKRDPRIESEMNEGLIIHYQRLKYAREKYSADMFTGYDDRGAIYVRYGEPHQKYIGKSIGFNINDVGIYDNESWVYNISGTIIAFDFGCKESAFTQINDLSELIRNRSYNNVLTFHIIKRLYEERLHLAGPYSSVLNSFGDIPHLEFEDEHYYKRISQISKCLLKHRLDKIKAQKEIPQSTI